MTNQEAIEKLGELARPGDPEVDHKLAEEILLELINDPKITAAFNAVEKWYA